MLKLYLRTMDRVLSSSSIFLLRWLSEIGPIIHTVHEVAALRRRGDPSLVIREQRMESSDEDVCRVGYRRQANGDLRDRRVGQDGVAGNRRYASGNDRRRLAAVQGIAG